MKLNVLSLSAVLSVALLACRDISQSGKGSSSETATRDETPAKALKFACPISNGMKGDSLFFQVAADGKKLTNLYFKGYWRCSGRLTQESAAGPKGSFDIVNSKADGVISEPPGGGSSAWRFEMHAAFDGAKATGTFRMNINGLGCDSYVLKFEGFGK